MVFAYAKAAMEQVRSIISLNFELANLDLLFVWYPQLFFLSALGSKGETGNQLFGLANL